MGLAKLSVEKIRLRGNAGRDEEMLGRLYELLRDEDSSVVCTALEAINEIEEEGLSMSRKLALYLLSNIHRFNDLQLPVVANYLELYEPKEDQ
jgi:vesicle coat complex subunit